MKIVVYFDFMCPYAYAANVWLREVQRQYPGNLTIEWKFFSLEQVNTREPPPWKLWEQPLSYRSRSLLAFRVAAAARRLGDRVYDRVVQVIFEARHARTEPIEDPDTLAKSLQQAGLDGDSLITLAADPATAKALAADHTEAVEKYNVFGTPTLVIDGQHVAYLKMRPSPPPQEALQVFREVMAIAVGRPNIYEIKRPTSLHL